MDDYYGRRRELIVKLNKIYEPYAEQPGILEWTSIQVGVDSRTEDHEDDGNVGISGVTAFGNHSGGRLEVKGAGLFDVNGIVLALDGDRTHRNEEFVGRRGSLVFFCSGAIKEANDITPATTAAVCTSSNLVPLMNR